MKALLKKIPAVRLANSFLKDVALSLETAWLKHLYESRVEGIDGGLVREGLRERVQMRMSRDGVRPISALKPLHIYLVGTYYDHEAYGYLQAMQRLGKVTIHLDQNGDYGINSSSHQDGTPATDADNAFLIDRIRRVHGQQPVDLVIGTFLASSISVGSLMAIRRMGIPVVNYVMDDRVPSNWRIRQGIRMGGIGLHPGVDLTLQTTEEYVPRYIADGGPCLYWAFASDPEIFSPKSAKNLDVVFIGNNYGKRGSLIESIRAAGIDILAHGLGFPAGHLPGDRVPELFSRAKIILGTGLVGHSSSIMTLKLRDFDGPMSGALYLTTANPDLSRHFEVGKEILVYRSAEECIKLIRRYLERHDEREAIAAAGRARAIREHCWDQRFAQLLEILRAPGAAKASA